MDRLAIASILPELEDFFGIGDSSSGLLQTDFTGTHLALVFTASYLVLAPLFGFLGDRRSRKRILVWGLALWSGVTLGSSFVPKEHFWLLLLGRALVGVGEASYSTVAPTLIADLFPSPARARALALFYLALPLGSGLGYMAGAKVKDWASDWRWALRVTPALGALALLLLVAVVTEPPRGGVGKPLPQTSWAADLRALATNRSLALSTLGFSAVAFVSGALALWAPAFLYRSRVASGRGPPCRGGRHCHDDESVLFGALTLCSGALGVGLGSELSRRLRSRSPRGDALLCGGGLLGAAPCLLLALLCAPPRPPLAYVFIFLGETLLSLNWAIVADILLDVVIPTRRATAEALQIVASHLLGDAGSPFLVGLLSDALQRGGRGEGRALQGGLLLCPFAAALGGGAFLGTALVLPQDRARARRQAMALLSPGDDVRAARADDVTGDVTEELLVPGGGGGGRPSKVPVDQLLA